MNRPWSVAAFALGLAAVLWVAQGYIAASPLALTMTLLIAAVYAAGGLELWRFQQATTGLDAALAALPADLAADLPADQPADQPGLAGWLARLPAGLQNPVRLRVEGDRVGLPGPALTPYLVGLLVLLGMLGTFLGMVVTLNGAVMALETTTDLPTIRAALAAPVKGLGLAFGTSVAGVAASAMLGLVSALCRRERLGAAQRLDSHIAGRLRPFTRAHQRQATLAALQAQAGLMPALLGQLQLMMSQAEQRSEDLNQRLLASQEQFHGQARHTYAALAASVDRSLKDSLTESARLAGASIGPAVDATLAGVARESAAFQARMVDTVQAQLDGLAARFGSSVDSVSQVWTTALAQHGHSSQALVTGLQQTLAGVAAGFEQRSAALLASVTLAHAALQADAASSDQQRLAAWTATLDAMAGALQREWQQAGSQTLQQQQQICETLACTARDLQQQWDVQARSTIGEVSQLLAGAADAPRAAAEVLGLMRQQLSDSLARDNTLLDERSRIMGTLATLLVAVNQAASDQRQAIDALVAASAGQLQQAGARLEGLMVTESARLGTLSTQLSGSAVEVASLGEAFGVAVAGFGETSQALLLQLQRIEGALDKSSARSDEQLAYCVAQAREIIDLSVGSQQQIVDQLTQLAGRRQPALDETT